ncbi:MAG: uL15m family ribosomal protein [Candidatus Aenigmatarchaeota archaeon]|nr:uL15 family ribosomal protein [Candidatus Aenigmarchaeota archaeon]
MVVRFKKKRRRGERTYHGRHGYPRGGGNRGGRGRSGKFDHKLMHFLKYERVEQKGFKYPLRREKKIINLQHLSNLIDRLILNGEINENNIEIDLNKFGYEKLVSKGEINKRIIVKVKSATKRAIEKIEKLGGKVILS